MDKDKLEALVKEKSEKFQVHKNVVIAILGNAGLLVTLVAENQLPSRALNKLRNEAIVHEFGARWMLVAEPLGMDREKMVTLVVELTTEVAKELRADAALVISQLNKEIKI